MRPHNGQLQTLRCGKVLDVDVPRETPHPSIIDKLRRKAPLKDDRPQPTISDDVNEETWRRYEIWKKEQDRKPPEGGERGVWEMTL